MSLSEKVGDEVIRHRLLNTAGWLHAEVGDLDQALAMNQQGAEGGRKRGDHETQANAEINLAEAHLARGDVDLAREILESVHRLVEDPATSEWQKWRYSIHLFAALGDLWLARGDLVKARRFADECLERATHTKSRRYLVRGWRLSGEIATARRAWDDAEKALTEALTIARAIGNPPQLWKTHAAWGRRHRAGGNHEAAAREFSAARNVIEGVRHRLQNPELRQALDTSSLMREFE
jgi:tetratricopeptide (TPR) repeat protein